MVNSGKIRFVRYSFLAVVVAMVSTACSSTGNSTNYVNGIENCSYHVERYFNWHKFAKSVGPTLDPNEIDEMEKVSGHTLIVTHGTAYQDVIAPEQEILEFRKVAATCKKPTKNSKPVGLVSIKYIDKNRTERWRYVTSYIGGTLTVGQFDPEWDLSEYVDIPSKYKRI